LDRIKVIDFIQRFDANIALDKIIDLSQIIVTAVLIHHGKAGFDRIKASIQDLDKFTECIGEGVGLSHGS
jgi:Lrp/AsnC family transcriptional regulator of ectoine degradation